jgi:hypothetical protein
MPPTNTEMPSANVVSINSLRFDKESGRLKIQYLLDKYSHSVHAIYHDTPTLPPEVWSICIGELALACAVDMATAALSKTIVSNAYNPGVLGWQVVRAVSDALRLEVLQAQSLTLDRLRLELRSRSPAPRNGPRFRTNPTNVMLLMGGGKDSLYCYRVLKNAGYHLHCFYLTEATRSWQRLKRVWNALDGEVPHSGHFLT